MINTSSKTTRLWWKICHYRAEPRQWLAILTGFWTGHGMDIAHTCAACGGPCRTSGGYNSRTYYDRLSCPNRICRNWIPF